MEISEYIKDKLYINIDEEPKNPIAKSLLNTIFGITKGIMDCEHIKETNINEYVRISFLSDYQSQLVDYKLAIVYNHINIDEDMMGEIFKTLREYKTDFIERTLQTAETHSLVTNNPIENLMNEERRIRWVRCHSIIDRLIKSYKKYDPMYSIE